jgi:1,4-dihydroxy-2-naphthoate octaprenyltransferase
MLRRSTIQLLRIHFSLFLLPVYLFALSQVQSINWTRAVFVFFILHLLVYPASNGYNSYMDRDETSIGGLAHPLQPTRQLFYVSVMMDALALILSFQINPFFAVGILLYILASRAYSYRRVRLKRYPVLGFVTVFIFQGALIYLITAYSIGPAGDQAPSLRAALIASLLIGALYPLTQIYQHEADKEDGVTTLSYVLGKRGTFIFSMLLYLAATFLLYNRFKDQVNLFYLYLLITFPVVLFFIRWMYKVWQDEAAADFSHSLRMNFIATLCTSLFFLTLIILKH